MDFRHWSQDYFLYRQDIRWLSSRAIKYTEIEAADLPDVAFETSPPDDRWSSFSGTPVALFGSFVEATKQYQLAIDNRTDLIMATGRSDHPNQENNVLGFPFIFRGALDVRATGINEAMKKAAVKALSNLAKEPVPEQVNVAYRETRLTFGKIIILD